MAEQTYTVTAYRDSRGREWRGDDRGRWYSGWYGQPDDLIEGSTDWRYGSLAELVSARQGLIPVWVDNVEALLADLAAVRKQLADAQVTSRAFVEPGGADRS